MATSQPLGYIIQSTVTSLTAFGLAFYYSWSLTLVTLALLPVAAFITSWITSRTQPSIRAQEVELTRASKVINNAIAAIDTVKALNGQDCEKWEYTKAIKSAAQYYLVQAQVNAQQYGFMKLVILGMFVQGFWYGSHLVSSQHRNPGDILTCFWACLMATQSVEQMQQQMVVLENGKVAGATLKASIILIERGRRVLSMVGGNRPLHCDGAITFQNVRVRFPSLLWRSADTFQVSFCYPSRFDKYVLKNATFSFAARETTFVVGKSGSGKSTIGNLLMRFYAPTSGEVLIGGHFIQTLDLDWLRSNITLVQQDSILFNETLFKNIAFGCRDRTTLRKEEVERAIGSAYLQDTISELPQGLDTVIGYGGKDLSGGQKQRVAIARARVRDTPVLILDEATNALDHINKGLVSQAIREWRKGKTTIIITHDMSQVRYDDFVYLLDDGEVIEQGLRKDLQKTGVELFKEKRDSATLAPVSAKPRKSLPLSLLNIVDLSHERRYSSATDVSEDSMDVQITTRKSHVPSVFGKGLDDTHSPRRSHYGTMMPVSPTAFSQNRRSSHVSGNSVLIHDDHPPLPRLESVDPRWTQEHKDIEMTMMEPANTRTDQIMQDHEGSLSRPARTSKASSTVSAVLAQERRKSFTGVGKEHVAPLTKIFMSVWPNLAWKDRVILVIGFASSLLHAAATPTFAYVFAKLLTTFYMTDRTVRSKQARIWSLSVLGVAIVDSISTYLVHYLLEYCAEAWIDSHRIEAFRRILDQPRSWFDEDKNSLSRLTECLDRNAEEMRNLLGRFAGLGLVLVAMTLMAVIWSLIMCWRITLVALATIPYMYAVMHGFAVVSSHWESRSDEAASATNAIFMETMSNIGTVRALTLEAYFYRKYSRAVSRALNIGLKRSAFSGLFFGLSDSGIIFVTALIFYYGAKLVSSHTADVEDIMTVFTMLLFSLSSANIISGFIPQISSSQSTATHLLRLSHLPYRQSHEHKGNLRLQQPSTIVFKDVMFMYPSRQSFPVLYLLNLTLAMGTSTAIVGSSGSGKSTIASLLLALHPPTSGAITINNHPISSLHTPTLRALIGLIPQQATIFPASVAQNIAYALPESSPLSRLENVRAAAKAAGIDEFIQTLENGYATQIGSGGSGLSGGQAQRIAIARALVRRPKLLILDEATSGLDQQNANGIRKTIKSLEQKGVGILAITHDKEMMKICRDIVVLKEGRVSERGRYEDLRWKGGDFTKLLSDRRGSELGAE